MIIREPRPNKNYYVLDNAIAEDACLSWEARGVLIFLLVKPDNWSISPAHLTKNGNAGRDKVYRILNELEEAGYITRKRTRSTDGAFTGINYLIHEKKPLPEKPHTAKPHLANPTLTSTQV